MVTPLGNVLPAMVCAAPKRQSVASKNGATESTAHQNAPLANVHDSSNWSNSDQHARMHHRLDELAQRLS
eukprot:2371931-Amphidinium_carterae.1